MERLLSAIGQAIASLLALAIIAVLLAVPAGFVYAIYKAFPRHELPAKRNPGWVDLVFENQYVVFSARIVLLAMALVLLFGGVYLAASIGVRMYRKEWLHRAGPFEADVAARAERQLEALGTDTDEFLAEVLGENAELEARLEVALDELRRVTEERDALAEGRGPSPPSEG